MSLEQQTIIFTISMALTYSNLKSQTELFLCKRTVIS